MSEQGDLCYIFLFLFLQVDLTFLLLPVSERTVCLFLIRRSSIESIRNGGLLLQLLSHGAGQRDLWVTTEARDGGKTKTLLMLIY